jgi:hypothetical protein
LTFEHKWKENLRDEIIISIIIPIFFLPHPPTWKENEKNEIIYKILVWIIGKTFTSQNGLKLRNLMYLKDGNSHSNLHFLFIWIGRSTCLKWPNILISFLEHMLAKKWNENHD